MVPKKLQENIDLLVDGRDAFSRILERIQNARKAIHINMFIWRDDRTGNVIAKELLEAADRGVKITISKDSVGSVLEKSEENKQSFLHKGIAFRFYLQQKLVDMAYYNSGEPFLAVQKKNLLAAQLLAHKNITIRSTPKSDHSKFYIFDGKILITGGMNIADRYRTRDITGRPWHDYMVELNGEEFVKRLIDRKKGSKKLDNSWFDFIINSRENGIYECKDAICKEIGQAEKNILVQMCYWGDEDITAAIISAAKKGVDITIIAARKANLQNDLNYRTLRTIMESSGNHVCIYLCRDMIHAKMMLIDKKRLFLGSANFNSRMCTLSELDIIMDLSPRLQKKLEKSIDSNTKCCRKVDDSGELSYNRIKSFFEKKV